MILTARDPDRVHRVGLELGASIAAFDATDFDRLDRFFDELPKPIPEVMDAAKRVGDEASKGAAKVGKAVRDTADKAMKKDTK